MRRNRSRHDGIGINFPREPEVLGSHVDETPALVEVARPLVAFINAEPDGHAPEPTRLGMNRPHEHGAVSPADDFLAQINPRELDWRRTGDAGRCRRTFDMRVADMALRVESNEQDGS